MSKKLNVIICCDNTNTKEDFLEDFCMYLDFSLIMHLFNEINSLQAHISNLNYP
jgi:hypothetical protein